MNRLDGHEGFHRRRLWHGTFRGGSPPLEALLVEQALAMVRELKGMADAARDDMRSVK